MIYDKLLRYRIKYQYKEAVNVRNTQDREAIKAKQLEKCQTSSAKLHIFICLQ